jgi:uroporphyrinogen III methyltransferase/synthase
MPKGKVYLVGAGPGDPGLITVRGLECLERADVIIYDRLVNRRLLAHARPGCELIGRGEGVEDQDEINRLMVERAREGRTVVRLKGGDPFLFGRGGEEAEFLAAAGIPFEVVPGVPSALAAPAYAGIPLTHRYLSSAVGIVTGHEASDKRGPSVKWGELGRAVDTLVILMGVGNLPAIVERLLEGGKSGDTPVALIRLGTLPRQEVLTCNLAEVVGKAQGFEPPAVIVVGEVVRLREEAGWFEGKPLFRRRILVVGEAARLASLRGLLAEKGAEVIELPVIRITPNEDTVSLDRAIEELADYDWLVFTSDKGVRLFWERLTALGRDTRTLCEVRVAAIGPVTAAALAERGVAADLIPERHCTEGLVESFASLDLQGRRVLLARSDLANPLLPQRLRAMGALVEEVILYRTVEAEITSERRAEVAEMLRRGEVDLLAFTSSSAARYFTALFAGPVLQEALQAVPTACLGPETARTARRLGLSARIIPERYTLEGLVEAIVSYQRREDGFSRLSAQEDEGQREFTFDGARGELSHWGSYLSSVRGARERRAGGDTFHAGRLSPIHRAAGRRGE